MPGSHPSTNKLPVLLEVRGGRKMERIQPFCAQSLPFWRQTPKDRNRRRERHRGKKKNNSIVELGLLLFQIASCSRVNYGLGVEGLREAKEKALHMLHQSRSRIWSEIRVGGRDVPRME